MLMIVIASMSTAVSPQFAVEEPHVPAEIWRIIFHMCGQERPLPAISPTRKRVYDVVQATIAEINDAEEDADDVELPLDADPLALEELDEPTFVAGEPGRLGWVRLGHVCGRWREILHNSCCSLWADDLGSLPEGFHFMLKQAGDKVPVSFHFYGSSYREPYTIPLDALLHDQSLQKRVREMHIVDMLPSRLEEIWPRLAECDFPILRELLVLGNNVESNPAPGESAFPLLRCPQLRSMCIVNFATFFTSHKVTFIDLRTQRVPYAMMEPFAIRVDDLMNMLTACKDSLLHLALDVIILELDNVSLREPIRFTSLKSIIFRDPESLVRDEPLLLLFSGIRYPSWIVIKIELECRYCTSLQQGSELFAALKLAGTPDPVSLRIRIDRYTTTRYGFALCMDFSTGPADVRIPKFAPTVSLRVTYPVSAVRRECVANLLKGIPHDRLFVIHLYGNYYCIEKDVFSVLRGLRLAHFYDEDDEHVKCVVYPKTPGVCSPQVLNQRL